ncbi:MAG: hypothetical protein SWH78_17635 [Thermodesulfobacteriota bacterium]|nr:hypothetical protein [Thermodesulfobacteriota bacterium]
MGKEDKDNETKELIPSDIVSEVVADIGANSKDTRHTKFALYYLLGLSPYQAALRAGYSPSYAKSNMYKRLAEGGCLRQEIERVLSKIPERYRQICQARLIAVTDIEGKILERCREDPDKAMKHPQVLKQIKQTAGVLSDEVGGTLNINFTAIQGMMRAKYEK